MSSGIHGAWGYAHSGLSQAKKQEQLRGVHSVGQARPTDRKIREVNKATLGFDENSRQPRERHLSNHSG